MKLNDKISWLMGRVQKKLFPHLGECFDTPFTVQEKRLVAILEIVQVEKYIPNPLVYQWRGRKPLDRQITLSAEEAVLELPTLCDRGTKKNAKGYKMSWNGYKLHRDINDMGLLSVPLSPLRHYTTVKLLFH